MKNLCRCNNCYLIFNDENPSENSFDFEGIDMPFQRVEDMEAISDGEGGEFWGCPLCQSDEYLIDITLENKDLVIIEAQTPPKAYDSMPENDIQEF